jgi:hypothetical protein
VLEHVAAHNGTDLELAEPSEESGIGQVARDVDSRSRRKLVMKDSHAALTERRIHHALNPRLCGSELCAS